MKTARFTDLVEKAGAPDAYLLWVPPKQDSVFQRALKEQRILTIHQENVGTKKDYGLVGFHEEPNAQFLVFSKSLKRFLDRRIIGINYDLLAKDSRAGKPTTAKQRAVAMKAAKKEKPKPAIESVDTTVRSKSQENVVAFETPFEKSAAVRARETESPAASKPSMSPRQTKPSKSTTAAKRSKDAKPLKQLQRSKKPESEKSPGRDRTADVHVLAVVRRAMKDLDAGKTVAAYKRLEALVARASEP